MKTIPTEQRHSIPIKEGEQISGLSRSTLYNLMGDGKLAFHKIGRRRLLNVRSLLAYLDNHLSR